MSKLTLKVAILDDYLQSSSPHFKHFDNSKVDLTVFQDTLPAFTHGSTTAAQKQQLIERLRPYEVISTMRERTPFPSQFLKELPNLKLLLTTGTQFQTFDLEAAKSQGVVVATATGKGRSDAPSKPKRVRDIKQGNAHSTTQHAWALILALARNIVADDHSVKSGGWQTKLATNLLGKKLGIVGLGRLGAAVAKIGVQCWGMEVLCWSQSLDQEKADAMAVQLGLPATDEFDEKTFKYVSKQELFSQADVVSIHYVLSARSQGIINKEDLDAMKSTALLVNTSRGPLIDANALLDTLEHGRIGGAALDVFDIEPLPADSPFRSFEWGQNCKSQLITTPHMGYVEEDLINTWYAEQAENLERFIEGEDVLNRLA